MQKEFKKKISTLVCVAFAATLASAVTAVLAPAWQVNDVAAESVDVNAFYMSEGAAMRTKAPYGMRFHATLGAQKYAEIKSSEIGVEYQLGMYVFPAEYLNNANAYEKGTTGEYAELKQKLDYVFYDSSNPTLEEVVIANNDGSYTIQGVITNMLYDNFDKDFIGVAYIAKTEDGETAYEYASFDESKTVRSVAKVASLAYDTYKSDTNVKAVFDEIIDGAYLKSLGVTYDMQTMKYTYAEEEYATVAEVVAARNAVFTVEMNETDTMTVSNTKQFSAVVEENGSPVNVLTKYIAWKSSNEQVATVDKQGKVTAIGTGEATITASYKDIVATCTLTVEENREEISLIASDYDLSKAAALTISGISGEVDKVTFGGTDITSSVNADNGAISVAYDDAKSYATGENAVVIETKTAIYTTTVTVANYVISDSDSLRNWYNNCFKAELTAYVVVSADFTYTGTALTAVYNANNRAGDLRGVFDGRGHAITGITLTGGGSFLGLIENATIKNIAFVDMNQNPAIGNGFFAQKLSRSTLENVYVSGVIARATAAAGGKDSVISEIPNNSTLTNVIFNVRCASGVSIAGPVLGYANSAGTLTMTNVLAITSNTNLYKDSTGVYASATSDFYTAVAAMTGSYFSVKNGNELFFNKVKVL